MKRAHVQIEYPCTADWDSMTPVGNGRHCAACDLVVHDLSAMTEDEARSLLAKNGEKRMCVRYAFDAAGEVLHRRDLSMEPREPKLLPPMSLVQRIRQSPPGAWAAAALLALAPPAMTLSGCVGIEGWALGGTVRSDARNVDASESPEDAADDAGGDATTPATDSGRDAGPDAGRDAGPDAGRDAGPDAGGDAGRDAGPDAGRDGGADADASDGNVDINDAATGDGGVNDGNVGPDI